MRDRRYDVLNAAHDAIGAERNETYGSVASNFSRAATIATALIGHPITAQQIGLIQIAVKLSRICETPTHLDSHADIAGYAACAYEAATSDPELQARAHKELGNTSVIDREGHKVHSLKKEAADAAGDTET